MQRNIGAFGDPQGSDGFTPRARIRQRKGHRLTAAMAKTQRRPGKYPDGNGLYLIVDAPNRRYWRYRYQWQGRERMAAVGNADVMSLDEARIHHFELRAMVRAGIDPLAKRDLERDTRDVAPAAPATETTTFRAAAEAHITAHEAGWKNSKHRQQWRNTLDHACKLIGNVPVADIDTNHVLKVLQPIWRGTPETANRLRGRIAQVIDFAAARGWRARGPNPASWAGHLEHMFPATRKLQPTEPHPALEWREAPAFMSQVREQPGMGALALQFAILTAARSGEVRGARWDEIDLTTGTWTIPGGRLGRMKGTNPPPHRVPLSKPALMILLRLAQVRDGSGLIFFGIKRGALLSDMTLTAVLRRMGRDDISVHGFRSTFRDWAADNGKPADAAERALAHVIGNKVRAAYERTDLFDIRRTLMNEWASFLAQASANQTVPHPVAKAA